MPFSMRNSKPWPMRRGWRLSLDGFEPRAGAGMPFNLCVEAVATVGQTLTSTSTNLCQHEKSLRDRPPKTGVCASRPAQ